MYTDHGALNNGLYSPPRTTWVYDLLSLVSLNIWFWKKCPSLSMFWWKLYKYLLHVHGQLKKKEKDISS